MSSVLTWILFQTSVWSTMTVQSRKHARTRTVLILASAPFVESEPSVRWSSTQPFVTVPLASKAMLTSLALRSAAGAMTTVGIERSVITPQAPIGKRNANPFVCEVHVLRAQPVRPQTIEKHVHVITRFRVMDTPLVTNVRITYLQVSP